MSAQPTDITTPHRVPTPREQHNAVEVTTEYLGLPTPAGIEIREDGAHIVVGTPAQFESWLHALGGTVNRAPALDGASLWTLRTETPERGDGSTVPVRVHIALVHGTEIAVEFRQEAGASA